MDINFSINKINLSIVIPVFNEEEIIELSLDQIKSELNALNVKYEVLVVDDGSTDKTIDKVMKWKQNWDELKILQLVSNRGHMAAITAGIDNAVGDWVCTIDADLQDPVYVISKMYKIALDSGVDVVYGVRSDRSRDSYFKRIGANLYYRIIKVIVGKKVYPHAADCRLMSRAVIDSLRKMPEKQKVYRLLVPWLGFSSATYEYPRQERKAGKSHYTLRKMVSLAMGSVISFSSAPLKLATWSGLLGIFVFFVGSIYVGFGWISGQVLPGWTSIMAAILLFGSIQLICLGILGEYIARIFTEVQGRPTYELTNKWLTSVHNEIEIEEE